MIKQLLAGLAASTLCCFMGAPTEASEGYLVPPHTKAASAAHPRSIVSPDGKYSAVMTVDDGEVGQVMVYKRSAPKRAVLVRFNNADSFSWVPHHGHLLVVATGGADYGEGMLATWIGGQRFRYLKRAKHPDGEGYVIKGIAANGRSVVYVHFTQDDDQGTTHSLRLP